MFMRVDLFKNNVSDNKWFKKTDLSISILLIYFLISLTAYSDDLPVELNSSLIQIKTINIQIRDIYQSSEDNWLYNFANKYHINTKEHVVLTLLPMALGDYVSPNDLLEAERLLRGKRYLRDASITLSKDGLLDVKVIDNWTLFPTLSFSRSGGENSSSIGIKDTNFLGQGIATTFKYQKDDQKSGYRFRVTTPTSLIKHSYASLVMGEYDTGSLRKLSFEKPFYTSDSSRMIQALIKTEEQESTFYQNDQQLGVSLTDSSNLALSYGWLRSERDDTAYRALIGSSFYRLDLKQASHPDLINYFSVRNKSFLWWGQERYQSKFQVLTNIYMLTNKEDINLGFHDRYQIGLGRIEKAIGEDIINPQLETSTMFILSYTASQGYEFAQGLLLHRFDLSTEAYDNQTLDNFYSFNYQADYFYPMTEKWSLYLGNSLSHVSEFREQTLGLGGDTGLRGYPTQYQHGKNRWLSSLEIRYYSDVELFESIAIGYVAFVDVGRAWETEGESNLEQKTLKSVGIGLRLFPKVVSGRNVFHIDFARPLSSQRELNDWEWRVQIKNKF